jgi:hypothetical protein
MLLLAKKAYDSVTRGNLLIALIIGDVPLILAMLKIAFFQACFIPCL